MCHIYKLVNGDSIELSKEIPPKSIDLILTDIPYNISKENRLSSLKGRKGIDFGEWDKNFDESILKVFIPLLKDNGSIVIFHSIEQFSILKALLESNGLCLKDKVFWNKTNAMPRNRDRRYISNVEMYSWYVKSKGKWTFNRQRFNYQPCVITYATETGKRYHPNQKNLKMIKEIIKIHSNEGDTILDPFSGSATVFIAAIQTNRNCYAIEKDVEIFEKSVERIKKILGQ